MVLPSLLAQALMVGCMNNVLLGYAISILNTALPALAADFGWCNGIPGVVVCPAAVVAHGRMNSALIAGAVIGCTLASTTLSLFGRRKSVVLIFLGFAVSAVVSTKVLTSSVFCIIRFLTGIVGGLATVIPAVYVKELVPVRLASFAGLLPAIAGNSGILLGILVGLPLAQPQAENGYRLTEEELSWNAFWWRRMIFFPSIIAVICLVMLFTTLQFEPPTHLRDLGKPSLDVELQLWGKDGSGGGATATAAAIPPTPSLPADAAAADVEAGSSAAKRLANAAGPPLEDGAAAVTDLRHRKVSLLSAVRSRKYLLPLCLGWVVAMGQQLSGMVAIIGSSNNIFLQAGLPGWTLTYLSACMAFLQLAASMICSVFTSYPPARLVSVGALLMGFTLLLLPLGALLLDSTGSGIAAVCSVLLFAVIFGLTYGPGLLLYLFAVLPPEAREMGLSVAFALNWLASVAAVALTTSLPQNAVFVIFSCVCFFIASLIEILPLVQRQRNRIGRSSVRNLSQRRERKMEIITASAADEGRPSSSTLSAGSAAGRRHNNDCELAPLSPSRSQPTAFRLGGPLVGEALV